MATQPTAAERRESWIVGLVAASVFFSVVNTTMVNVALPAIGETFDANPARLGWLVTIYSLTFGIGTPFYGRLGDRYGLRRMFVTGLIIFVAASLLAGLAPVFPVLILFRAGQALGSAAIPSLGIAMIALVVPGERRGRALGVVSTAVGAGAALGPTLGGMLTQLVSWRMVFLVSALLGLLIPLCLRYLPATGGERGARVDWLGGITLGAMIGGLLVGITGAQRQGLTSPIVVVSFAVGMLGFGLTFWRQRVAENPFVERILLSNRRYLLLCLIGFCTMAANIGTLVIAPFLFAEVNGLSAGAIGLAMMPAALAVAVLSRTSGRLSDHFDPFTLTTLGLTTMLAALLVAATIGIGWPAVAFSLLLAIFGVGQAFVNTPLSAALTGTVPPRVYGSGLGIYNMLFFVGSGFGAALSTAILELRDDAENTLLPVYIGSERFTEFSDAFLPAIVVIVIALVALRIAGGTRVPDS